MKQILASALAPKAVGPYCQAQMMNSVVYLSGQLPINPEAGTMPDTIEEQTRQSLTNVANILREANMTLMDVMKTTVLLSDIKDFAAMNQVYAEIWQQAAQQEGKPVVYPARICYQVAALPMGAKVEIDCIAGI